MAATRGGYLVTEADGTQHLPTEKNGALDRGLCGAAWAALHGGYRGQTYDGPNKKAALAKLKAIYTREGWEAPSANSASFSTGVQAFADTAVPLAQEMVTRSGLIFKAGEYDDYTVTPADLDGTVAAFAPVEVELEHFKTQGIDTILDGHLGTLERIWHDGDGNLYGDMRVPPWLDNLWQAAGRKVSVVINTVDHQLARIGMVMNPRIKEAAMMSAYNAFVSFAAESTTGLSYGDISSLLSEAINKNCSSDCHYYIQEVYPEGRVIYQNYSDDAIYEATYAIDDNRKVTLGEPSQVTRRTVYEPLSFAQKLGDGIRALAGKRHSRKDQQALQSIHDISAEQGATCAAPAAMSEPGKGDTTVAWNLKNFKPFASMTPEQREAARAAGATDMPPEDVIEQVQAEASFAAREAREKELNDLKAERDQVKAERDEAQREKLVAMSMRLQAEASGFIDGLINAGTVLTREREFLISDYHQRAMDDAQHGVVSFSDGKQGTRIEQFKASMSARPSLKLVGEQLAAAEAGTTVPGETPAAKAGEDLSKPMTQEERDQLLSFTDQGAAAVARRKSS